MIESIEGIYPKLEMEAVIDGKCLGERKIYLILSRASDRPKTGISPNAHRRNREFCCVELTERALAEMPDIWIAGNIQFVEAGAILCTGPISREARGRTRIGDRARSAWTAVLNRQTVPGFHGHNPADSPSRQRKPGPMRPGLSIFRVPDTAEDEALRMGLRTLAAVIDIRVNETAR